MGHAELDLGIEEDDFEESSFNDLQRAVSALEHSVGFQLNGGEALPPDADESQLARLVQRLFNEGYEALWPERRQWRMNEAYSRGEFGAVWHDGNHSIEHDDVEPRVHVPIYNATCAILEARLNSTRPDLVVAARSTDQSAQDRAKAAARAAKSMYSELGIEDARREVTHKLVRKGSVFGKLVHDPNGGKYLGKTTIPLRDEEGNLVPRMVTDTDQMSPTWGEEVLGRDEQGQPDWEVERDEATGDEVLVDDYEGEDVFTVLDPESIIPDPNARRWKDKRWHQHFYDESPASIMERLGFTGITADNKAKNEDTSTLITSSQRPSRTSRREDASTARVIETYFQRGEFPASDKEDDTVSFPDGWIVVECQGQVRAMPNEYGQGPIWFAKASVGDEQLHGECIGNELRGLQATYTEEMSNWSLVNEMTGNPRIFWPAGAGTPDEEKVGDPGALIQVEGMRDQDRPYIMPGVTVPAGVESFIQRVRDEIGYVSGVREGGMAGGVPPNVEAAAAFEILRENDATRLATTTIGYGLFLQDLLKQIIWNLQTFAPDSKLYAIVGADLTVEMEEFAGSDVDADDLVYIVVPESIKPQSDAAKKAAAYERFDRGLATRRDTLEALGAIDGTDALLEQRLMQQCKRESKQCLQEHRIDTPIQLMQFEDVELALDMHRADLFDQRYADDPEAQAVMLMHISLHIDVANGMMPQDPAAEEAAPPTQEGPEPGMETGPVAVAG